jgi:YVTN family beta-propeller protein
VLAVLATVSPASAARAGRFAYVANSGGNTVSVINTASNTVTGTIAVGARPFHVAITPNSTRAYVANFDSNTVSVIDIARSATVTVGVGANPAGVAIADVEEPPGPRPAPAGPGGLPITGSRSQTLAAIALTMIGLGAALLTISHRLARRRRDTA